MAGTVTRPDHRRRSRAEGAATSYARALVQVAKLEREVKRLRDALAWYADPDKYQEHRTPLAAGGVRIDPPDVLQDQGGRARAALTQKEDV
jgi:hypothetical protein